MCIEICLTSNLLYVSGIPRVRWLTWINRSCKTVSDLESHHIQQYLKANHPITICVRCSQNLCYNSTEGTLPCLTSTLSIDGRYSAVQNLSIGRIRLTTCQTTIWPGIDWRSSKEDRRDEPRSTIYEKASNIVGGYFTINRTRRGDLARWYIHQETIQEIYL